MISKGIKLHKDLDIDFSVVTPEISGDVYTFIGFDGSDYQMSVNKGDRVEKYSKIAVCEDIPIYASVTGVFEGVCNMDAGDKTAVFAHIKNEGGYMPSYSALSHTSLPSNADKLSELFKNAAIIDTFNKDYLYKTFNKEKQYEQAVLFAVDDTPYDVTSCTVINDYEDEVLEGLSIINVSLKLQKSVIMMQKNFKTAKFFKKRYSDIEVVRVPDKYPAKINALVYAKKHNALVLTPETCRAVYRAGLFKEPMVNKVITVWGDAINKPAVAEIPIGTVCEELLDIFKSQKEIDKIVAGGVMNGFLMMPDDAVMPFVNSLTVMGEGKATVQKGCITCGRCTAVCPIGLAPYYVLRRAAREGSAKPYFNFEICLKCGCCSYVCPANIPLDKYIQLYNDERSKENEKK
ncbi:MAG: 4Fe-4S dicluster domain-containing protein [Oscillospiraceae bacterium]|nr:4Fe-4S dicluster domain-containing protein [Candidatus Equicaccousia limihippi]